MGEGDVVFSQDADVMHWIRAHSVGDMEGEFGALAQIVRVEQSINLCYVLRMEGVDGAFIKGVHAVHDGDLTSVRLMGAGIDARIVLHGLTRDAVQRNMMSSVRPVSNDYFQMIREARLYMRIPRKFVFVIQSMNTLRDFFMTDPCILLIVIAPCAAELTIENRLGELFYV